MTKHEICTYVCSRLGLSDREHIKDAHGYFNQRLNYIFDEYQLDLDSIMIALVEGDMLERMRQYDKAQVQFTDGLSQLDAKFQTQKEYYSTSPVHAEKDEKQTD